MTTDARILFVSHNHPSLFAGGAEIFAHDLFNAMRRAPGWDAFFLARTGPKSSSPKIGTPFLPVDGDPSQCLAFVADFDHFYGVQPRKDFALVHFRELLETYRPDIIHFQHTVNLGYELLEVARQTLPSSPIVYTLHEYLPICFSHGQMVRPNTYELCDRATPYNCHRCFPDRTPQQFFLRERLTKEYFRNVDLFLSPSKFLVSRYVEWGLPADRIRYLENGRKPQPEARPRRIGEDGHRNRFAFFGQLNPYKGLLVLLEAMVLLQEEYHPDVHLDIHGSNLDLQREDFKSNFTSLLEEADESVTYHGAYEPADMPRLMKNVDWVVIPSIWWENAPLVIQEAFMHKRPVLCSDIGGMAEKVAHGVNGLHFKAQDPQSLAETLIRASATKGLWDQLRENIPRIPTTDEAVAEHELIYRSLLKARQGAQPRDAAAKDVGAS